MLLLYPSANRDEAVFADPYRFDVRRDPNPHVAFGAYGRHHCLGAPLARLELRILFEELLARFDDIELVDPSTTGHAAPRQLRRRHRDAADPLTSLRRRRRRRPVCSTARMHVVRWLAEAAAWAVVAADRRCCSSPRRSGWSKSMLVAVGQALTTVLGGLSVLVAIFGRVWSNWPLTIAALVAVAGTVVVIAPALRRRRPAEPATGAVACCTPTCCSRTPGATPRSPPRCSARTPTCSHSASCTRRTSRRCCADPARPEYPAPRPPRRRRTPTAWLLWSRHPLADVEWLTSRPAPDGDRHGLPARRRRAARRARPQPTRRRRAARPAPLGAVDGRASTPSATSAGPPTMIVADLNAARWHPPLRRLLGRGWRDAHESVGRGLSVSWPTTGAVADPVRPPRPRAGRRPTSTSLAVERRRRPVPGSDHRALRRPRRRAGQTRRTASRQRRSAPAARRTPGRGGRSRASPSAVISPNVRPSPSSGTNSGS